MRRLRECITPSLKWQKLSAPNVTEISAMSFNKEIDIDKEGNGWVRWTSEVHMPREDQWIEYYVQEPEVLTSG